MRSLLLISILAACGPGNRHDDFWDAPAKPIDAPCPTAITGKVYAPNGTMPLYNVQVYVPFNNPGPFTEGVTCDQCSSGLPGGDIAHTTSASDGSFRLEGVVPGKDIPLIITIGKWRRMFTVPQVAACVDTPVPDHTLKLPKNRTEGDIPRIAVVTGGCDPLGCILSKIGIDSSEFGDRSSGPTRVVFYNGSGGTAPGTPQTAQTLWGNITELSKFDVVINSCECDEYNTEKTSPDVLRQYADIGGRVFGSHYHYTWMKNLIPQWQPTASWTSASTTTPDLVDMSFGKGKALAEWLIAVGASTTLGEVTLGTKTYNVGTVNPPTQRWLYASGGPPATTHYMSFNTPVGVAPEQQCGKVVYAGLHVSSGSVGTTFPSSCSASFTPDEKALAFLMFDLSSCVNQVF